MKNIRKQEDGMFWSRGMQMRTSNVRRWYYKLPQQWKLFQDHIVLCAKCKPIVPVKSKTPIYFSMY